MPFGHKVTKKYHNTSLVIKEEKLQSFKSKDVIPPHKSHNSSSRLILEHGQVNIPSTLRCYGCLIPDQFCTVPCGFPQKCFLRAPTPYSSSKKCAFSARLTVYTYICCSIKKHHFKFYKKLKDFKYSHLLMHKPDEFFFFSFLFLSHSFFLYPLINHAFKQKLIIRIAFREH